MFSDGFQGFSETFVVRFLEDLMDFRRVLGCLKPIQKVSGYFWSMSRSSRGLSGAFYRFQQILLHFMGVPA